jgi:hypothetical protein
MRRRPSRIRRSRGTITPEKLILHASLERIVLGSLPVNEYVDLFQVNPSP